MLATLLTLLPLAHAGSGNAAPRAVTPFGVPANALIRPGQTWVLSGTTVSGERLRRETTLGAYARPQGAGWDFGSPLGIFSWQPKIRTVVVEDMTDKNDIQLCFAIEEQRGARGILISGTDEQIDLLIGRINAAIMNPGTPDQLIQDVRTAGVDAGTCTLTRLR